MITGGASRAVTAATGTAEADPLIAEAEHIGRAVFHHESGGAARVKHLMKVISKHPELSKYAQHAVKAHAQEEALHTKLGKFIFGGD